jgi:SAM-dependent methyltransferase
MREGEYEAHARTEEGHWWFVGRRALLLALLDHVAPTGSAVADLGCGTGGNAAAFADAGYAVSALDASPAAIALAQARYRGVRFIVGDDPRDLRPQLGPQATAVLADVLEHLDDDRHFLARAVDVVGEGGHVILTVPADPALWGPHDVAFGHRRRYTKETLRSLWVGLPVKPRLVSHFNARLHPLVAGYRRVFRHGRQRAGGDLSVPMGPLNGLFRMIFTGEQKALLSAMDAGAAPYRRGVSLIAVLQRS